MTYQILTASETLYGPFLLRRTLLHRKQQALQEGVMLSDDFIASVERFAERNAIVYSIGRSKKRKQEVCPHCLKAFILQAAEDHELAEDAKALLGELFAKEDMGHNGYYLDNQEVKKVLP